MGRTTSKRNQWSLGLGVCAALWIGLPGAEAHASGFAAARFGGEHGHPTTDNATAIYYNPAGIALSKGTHIYADATMALRWASYDRPETSVNNQMTLDAAPGANSGKSTLFNGIVAPFVGATSDFGTDFIYGGLALYFPFGGSAVWDKNPPYTNSDRFPGAVDGTQRWYSIDGTIRSMYVTGALGFNIKKIGLTLGVSGSAIRSEVVTIRARNSDGTDDLLDVNGNLKEGRSYIDVNGWQGGFAIGATYNLLKKDKLWLGASYTSQPNVVGGMTLEGNLNNTLGLAEPSVTPVELTQTLPEIIRFGVRYRPTAKSELRLFGDFTRWAVFDRQCVLDKGVEGRSCEFDGVDTALDDPASFGGDGPDDGVVGVTQHLPRYWKNAGGVHPTNNLTDIFGLADRQAAYQYRIRDSIDAFDWAPEAGAQVSYSGGLIENISSLGNANQLGYSPTWFGGNRTARSWMTSGANARPRLDIVVFPFHHALMPLLDESAMRKQVQLYKEVYADAWGASPGVSKGFFPSEMAFSTRMIPVLASEGIE